MTREELSMALTHAEVDADREYMPQMAKNEAFIVKFELVQAFSTGSEESLSNAARVALQSTRHQFKLTGKLIS